MQDLLTVSDGQHVENMFYLPHPGEWQTDTGIYYEEDSTGTFAATPGFTVRNVTVMPPGVQWDPGRPETFNRDDVDIRDLPNAVTVR